jgi:hypothetical protein
MSFFNKFLLINSSPNSKRLKEYKKTLNSLNQIQWETSIGLMLGDASIQTQNKGKTYRLKFEWSDKNKPYLDHVYNLFDEWVISFPHKKSRFSPKGNLVVTWGFQTISHEAFNPLAELFILNNKKSIKDFLIKDYLTARGLAYWFMDDGGKLDYNINSKNKSLVLNTQSFTELEVIKLASELTDKFKLSIQIRTNKGKKIIVINSESFILFKELIDPYIIPQMRSKLPNL